MLKITSSEAAGHKLPRAAVELDPGATGMSAARFPADGKFVTLSGPPGGPLGLEIEAYKGVTADAAGLEKLVAKRFEGRSPVKGAFGEVSLSGGTCAAMSWATDSSMARAAHLVALFPSKAGASEGVLLDFWMEAGSDPVPAPAEFLKAATYGDVLRSVRVRFE
jgi:hypothetical protein